MNPTVLIYRSDLLPPSETFVDAQAHALRCYKPVFAGLRRIPTGIEVDPEETVTLTRVNGLRDKLRRRIFLQTGIAPDYLRKLALQHPVLLHAHFAVDAAAALPIQKHLGIPLIVSLHGYDVTSTDESLRSTAAGRVYLRRRDELFARTRLFLCASEHIRTAALAHGFPEVKLRTLRIGVDIDNFAPDPLRSRDCDPIVLFVGRLAEVKGCEHLIRAMAHVEQRHPEARLLIIGDGPLLPALRAQASEITRRTTFLGAQPPVVVRDLLHRSTLLVVPSVATRTGNSEGLSIAACEAQALARPIAGFRGSGLEEAVVDGDTALFVPPRDHAALADAICALLEDPGLAARLGETGRRRAVACFSLARQTALLERIYDEVLA